MLICLDTETTGLRAGYDEVLQLTIIDGNENVLMNEYFKPDHAKSWPDAQRVNHISPWNVKDRPSIQAFKARIEEILSGADLIVGYNVGFDLSMLRGVGIAVPETPVYDVMKEFAPIYGEWNDYYGDYKWQKLERCAAYYHYKWEGGAMHDSLGDTKATLYCYRRMTEDK